MNRQIIDIKKPCWLDDSDFLDLTRAHKNFQFFEQKYTSHHNMERFATCKAVSLIYCSNKLEDTFPKNVKEGTTFKILSKIASEDTFEYVERLSRHHPSKKWNVDGDGMNSKSQMVQHMLAFRHLISNMNGRLNMDLILKTHEILMDGATKDNGSGEPILNGKIRTFGVNNGVEDYLNHCLVPSSLQNTIDNFNDAPQDSDPIDVTSRLLFDFLTIHPFEDGNGRMGRLLVAFALMQSGTPFPVLLTSGKKRSRKHFYEAIRKTGNLFTDNPLSPLSTFIAYSTYLGWKNFINQVKVIGHRS